MKKLSAAKPQPNRTPLFGRQCFRAVRDLQEGFVPSFEEGWPRRSRKWSASLESARPGAQPQARSETCLTSPPLRRCSLGTITWFNRRSVHSSKEGIKTSNSVPATAPHQAGVLRPCYTKWLNRIFFVPLVAKSDVLFLLVGC